jgi:hypothetical protein
VQHDSGILADGIEHSGSVRLRDRLSHHVNAFRLEPIEMG